jgi:hypothetical protein
MNFGRRMGLSRDKELSGIQLIGNCVGERELGEIEVGGRICSLYQIGLCPFPLSVPSSTKPRRQSHKDIGITL